MRIEQFRYLVTIERLGSISAAAKFYNMNQNTLSTIVRQAEEEFGIKLFKRSPAGISCTEAGKEFIRIASEIDIGYSRIMSIKKQPEVKASVLIAMDAVTCSVFAMPITEAFYESGSRGNLRFFERETSSMISRMNLDTVKLMLIRVGEWNRSDLEKQKVEGGFSVENLASDELCLVVSKEHPLAQMEVVSAEQLLPYKLIWHQAMEIEVRSILGAVMEGCAGVGSRCFDKHLAEAVDRRQMVAVVSRLSARVESDWQEDKFCVLGLTGTEHPNRMDLVLCYRQGELKRPRYKVMKDLLPELVSSIVGEARAE